MARHALACNPLLSPNWLRVECSRFGMILLIIRSPATKGSDPWKMAIPSSMVREIINILGVRILAHVNTPH